MAEYSILQPTNKQNRKQPRLPLGCLVEGKSGWLLHSSVKFGYPKFSVVIAHIIEIRRKAPGFSRGDMSRAPQGGDILCIKKPTQL